ncbi:pentapeptide repeat-containing protein [Nostoc sp. NMS9]|uniref:pentapeptide repeat-containing protein n=1 Tax=Nostoc sp. NMS9 TaxID=2815393 RepID=UPI0025E72E4C|nr:pentapeptide repeat-containing protein [Nostoc sp. NMS9]MBN3942433.1 pentapeptide repeat-containing protein [Nostoc sp. NMS9]
MRQTVAIRRIESFEKRFRKPHLYLAYHAAFPLALTPDLLYRLWANFQQDIHGELLNIPWEAVADLLLSSLCEEVGHELYEMDSAIRNELLARLKADEKFYNTNSKQDRILQLSDFLLEYVDRQLQSEDLDVRDFAEAQHWTALAYAKPSKAVEQIARAFSQLQATASEFNSTDKTEILRLASLVETFAEPLAEAQLEPLLVYTRAMASFSRGDIKGATAQLSKIAEAGKLEIAGQELPIPEQIKENLGKPSLPIGKDFSSQNLKGQSFKGQDLTEANFSYADLQGANFTNARLVGANFSYVKTGLQGRWAFALMFCCFLLLILSTTAASLIGTGWVAIIDSESQKKTTVLITTGILILVIFAIICISNIGKSWQSILQRGLILTVLLSPIALLIAILLSFALKTVTLPSSNSEWTSFVCYMFSSIGFSLCSFWTIYKGVGRAWVASALALVGSACLTIMISIGIFSLATSSLKRIQSEVFLVGVGVTVCLAFAFAYFYQNHLLKSQLETRETGNRLHILGINFRWIRFPWVIAIIVAIALGVSQFFGKVDITIGLSLSGIALIWALSLVYETARTRATLVRMFGLALLFSGIVAICCIGIVFIVTSNTYTASEQAEILALVLPTALIVAMFLILAGAANLSGAITGIIFVTVVVAVFFTLVLLNDNGNSLYNSLFQLIAFVDLLVLGGITAVLATAVIMAIGIVVTWVESGNRVLALIWGVVLALITLVLTVGTIAFSKASSLVIAGTIVTGLATIQLGAYIAWQALAENVKFISVRNFALAFAGAGGTNFFNADLTDANFSQATLKCANFQQAKLKGTRWFQVNQLELASGSDSYLRYPSVQRLLISGNGQNQNFDGLDLRGINLRGANLADASFLNTDLSEADLQGANLSRAKLINTRLNGANLAIAQLTGVFIYNCELTPKTKLAGVECDYIYTKLPTNDNPDPGRKPEVNGRIFKPGELAEVLMILYSTQSIGHEGDRSIN